MVSVDNLFLRLVRNIIQAGYLEDWRWNATLSVVPQGGVVTPPTQWATCRWSPSVSVPVSGWRVAVPSPACGDAVPDGDLLGSDEDVLGERPEHALGSVMLAS
jgi:hypothetical protein